MPVPGKEIERQVIPEEISQPVEQMGYVEKIEKQTEIQQPANPQPQQIQQQTGNKTGDMGKIVSAQFAVQTKPNINLPYTEQEVIEGLHQKVWKGIKWASEFCVMMIKKYPGRVFYLPPEAR